MEPEACLSDQIKQKEQDFIKTLKDIAEAAFITDSLETDNNTDMDDNQVDSDLSQVAREISRSTNNIMDESSDVECEANFDEAVQVNDTSQPENTSDDINQNHQCHLGNSISSLENSQTMIKIDVMDELDRTMEPDHHPQQINLVESLVENQADHERNPNMGGENCDVATEENQENCWKIDYIRVETPENSKTKRKPVGRNEVWRTTKSEKGGKKKKSSKDKERDREKKRNKKKGIHFPLNETLALKKDKTNSLIEAPPNIPRGKCRKIKAINKLSEVLRIKPSIGLNLDSLEDVLENYNPSVPRGTSQKCIDALSDSDLEMLLCPACNDRFLLPTTFFQHIFRKSILIQFNCSICRKILNFHNKCSLKIHIQTHLENDEVENIETDMLEVMSLNNNEVKLNSDTLNVRTELKSLTVDHTTEELCMECLQPVSKADLMRHFSTPTKKSACYECRHCGDLMPTKCCQTAHEKIHTKKSPYICPECGKHFHTWNYFQTHQNTSCYHHRKTFLIECPLCPEDKKYTSAREAVVKHIADFHCTKYHKCCECSSAFREKSFLSRHISEKHEIQSFKEMNIFKFKSRNGSIFHTNRDSLIEDISKSIRLPFVFVLQCVCHSYFKKAEDLSEHLEKHEDCRLKMQKSDSIFHDPPEDLHLQREIMDNLKYFQEESQCSSCNEYNEKYQIHLEKHLGKVTSGGSEKTVSPVQQDNNMDMDKTPPRVTRLMKRSCSSEVTGEILAKIKCEDNDTVKSPPLKLTIKLTPEIAKSLEPPDNPIKPFQKKEEKKNKSRNQKVKFNVPEPIVESLGIDVPSGKDLILLNRLFHSPDAFSTGSVVKAENLQKEFQCSQCEYLDVDRKRFQSHIIQHKSCQSFFQCMECGTCFAAEPSWKKHLLLMHRIKDPGPEHYCQDLMSSFNMQNIPSDEESLDSDAGLVIDTGEDCNELDFDNHFPGHDSCGQNQRNACHNQTALKPKQDPTCLACGENFQTISQFKEHKCATSLSVFDYPVNDR